MTATMTFSYNEFTPSSLPTMKAVARTSKSDETGDESDPNTEMTEHRTKILRAEKREVKDADWCVSREEESDKNPCRSRESSQGCGPELQCWRKKCVLSKG